MLKVSKAIIYHRNDYLLQLRDHTPGIVYFKTAGTRYHSSVISD